jgi:hypothetical protein
MEDKEFAKKVNRNTELSGYTEVPMILITETELDPVFIVNEEVAPKEETDKIMPTTTNQQKDATNQYKDPSTDVCPRCERLPLNISPHQTNVRVFKYDKDGRLIAWAACRRHRVWWMTILENIKSADFFVEPPEEYKQVVPILALDVMAKAAGLVEIGAIGPVVVSAIHQPVAKTTIEEDNDEDEIPF